MISLLIGGHHPAAPRGCQGCRREDGSGLDSASGNRHYLRMGIRESSGSPTDMRRVHGACPLDCPDTCSWVVTVENGRAVRLEGDREHPYTRGSLCVKVNHYLEMTRRPDR